MSKRPIKEKSGGTAGKSTDACSSALFSLAVPSCVFVVLVKVNYVIEDKIFPTI